MKPTAEFLEALKAGKIQLPALPKKKDPGAAAPASPPGVSQALKVEEPSVSRPSSELPRRAEEKAAQATAIPAAPPPPPPMLEPVESSKIEPPAPAPPTVASGASGSPPASIAEIVRHAAEDSIFYSRTFFPKTFRQKSPQFHVDIWSLLDDPTERYINIQVQRDGAKTTLLRTYCSKRISYGLSRTILYIGASQGKAINSVEWIQNQVMRNKLWAETFQLERSKPWTGEKTTIRHKLYGHTVTILAFGITGSIRGLNIDDQRPDLIIVDDVVGDDNSATAEQRRKVKDLVLGAVKESLAPASEVPDAKMVILNTPQDFEDLSQQALSDPQFASARFGCWTAETEDLPIEMQESAWPERYPSEVLREEKRAAISRNALSIFAREKECKLITPESSSFRAEWLQYYENEPPLHEAWIEYIIDPVPPPSETTIAKGLAKQDTDFEAHTVMCRHKGNYYVLESIYNRGHDPGWSVKTFVELSSRWRPRKVIVESVAYQAALAWLLREAMKRTGVYFPIHEFKDKRKKIYRITQGIQGPASNRALWVKKEHAEFISQFIHYPGKNPRGNHDDVIETVAIGLESLQKGFVGEVTDTVYSQSEAGIPELEYERGAP